MDKLLNSSKCPGLYCGRELLANNVWSDCGPCPRGFRSNGSSLCLPCDGEPTFYDYLYLGFDVLLILILQLVSIDLVGSRSIILKEVMIIHLSAVVETAVALALSLLLTHPIGSFSFKSCPVKSISDWYTLFYNPNPNFEKIINCTQEAVYPLYTIVFLFYMWSIVIMLLIRPFLVHKYIPKKGKYSIYSALYFIPALAAIHAVGSGLIYYSFPYMTIILSALSCATHFALQLNQTVKVLFLTSLTDIKNGLILIGHWLLHGYGLIAVITLHNLNIHPGIFIIIPLPTLFYILTTKFTDPHKLHFE